MLKFAHLLNFEVKLKPRFANLISIRLKCSHLGLTRGVLQVCGVQCAVILSLTLTTATISILFSTTLYCRRRGSPQNKYHVGSTSNPDYHSSLHQTSSISTIHTNCTNNR